VLDGAPHVQTIARLTEAMGLSPKRFISCSPSKWA